MNPITGIHQYTGNLAMTRLRPACCLPLLVVLLPSVPLLSSAMVAGVGDGATPAPDSGAWLLLIVIGIVMSVVTAGVLVYSF